MSIGGDAVPANAYVGYYPIVTKTLTPSGAGNVLTAAAETGLYDSNAPDTAAGQGTGPCRQVNVTGNGNLVFTLWGDDTATAGLKQTLAVTAGQVLVNYLIRKVWSTSTASFIALG